MKTLNFNQMEAISGGSVCDNGVADGVMVAAMVTLNPIVCLFALGVGLGCLSSR